METNVFPVAACLVAAPNTGIALCACPAVERNDEGTGVVAILRHDATDVGHTVQTEGVTPADPCHVCFEHADTGVAHLLDDVALQEGFDAVFGVKIALRPQSDFHTFGAGVISECFEVLDVAVECRRLSVAGAVAVVGEEPAEGHVIVEIAIDGSARRELIIVEFAVETFANAAIVLLAFVVGLAILHFHETLAVFRFRPVVAVVGVEVTLIKTKFGQQHGVSGELIEAAEQGFWVIGHPEEDIEIFFAVAELHLLGVRGAEVIKTGFEGVPHHAVALRAPIERGGGGHTAVHPVVGVLDGDALSAVREATVLHAAAVEVLSGPTGEFQMRAVAVEGTEGGRFDHRIDLIFLVDGETAVAAIEHHFDLIGGEGALLVVLLHIESRHVFARLFDEDVGGRFCFGVVGGAAGGILVDAENVVSVEIYRDFSVVFVA